MGGLLIFLGNILRQDRLMIATLKDKDSVLRILSHYNLEINPALVLTNLR